MSAAILLPTWRADGDWRDLALAVHSLAAYAADVPLLVGWDGPAAPELGHLGHPALWVRERPPGMSSAEAFHWLAGHTNADGLVMWSDDCVASPDTVARLLADSARLQALGMSPGLVGCRSVFAFGPQNVRSANGGRMDGPRFDTEAGILEVEFAAPFAAWMPRSSIADGGPPTPFEWYGDNLLCRRLLDAGRRIFISTAYVHHVGMRSSQAAGLTAEDLDRAGREALAASNT